jgi:hypothetical protein
VRADAGRAATFFTVEAGTFESYLPDEATLAASVAGRLDRTTGVVHQAGQRWRILFRRWIARGHREHVADRAFR